MAKTIKSDESLTWIMNQQEKTSGVIDLMSVD
jgi:ribosomal protein L15E